jgi:hypothetical protein
MILIELIKFFNKMQIILIYKDLWIEVSFF